METTITVGPFLVPAPVLAGLVALVFARLALGIYGRNDPVSSRWTIDRGTYALLIAFVIWKLWPIIPWWKEIVRSPDILLRLPGGRTGLLLGVAGALIFVGSGFPGHKERYRPVMVATLTALVGFLMTTAVIENLMAETSIQGAPGTLRVDRTFLDGSQGTLLSPDKPTVVTFWATWCGPCRAEIPIKKRFYQERSADMHFVSINLTATESSPDVVSRFVDNHGISYPVLLDTTGSLSRQFAVRGTPTTMVLTPEGTVLSRWTGPSSLDRLERSLAQEQGE